MLPCEANYQTNGCIRLNRLTAFQLTTARLHAKTGGHRSSGYTLQ